MSVSVHLGPRLSLVASFVPEHSFLGDIGTDHAYLPIYLWETGKIQRAVAVDVHEGPFQSARSAIAARGLESIIDVRWGDGLKPIQPGEVDVLTLAGMGGNTMLEIFGVSRDVLNPVHTLVLQPQGAEGKVRLTLLQSGWKLKAERLVKEDERVYVVMNYARDSGLGFEELNQKVEQWSERIFPMDENKCLESAAEPSEEGRKKLFTKLIWDLGPLLLEQPVPELLQVLNEQIVSLSRTVQEMQKSKKPEVRERIHNHRTIISWLEGLKACLFPSASLLRL